MSKLREQLTTNDRLREYIERMLSVIIETSPQLLEITLNAGVPIGVPSSTPSNNQLIIASDDIVPMPSNTSNDKYCCL